MQKHVRTENNRNNRKCDFCTYSRVPRLKTWRELGLVEVAPTKADPELDGVMTTLFGTPVKTTLPRTMRQPFLITGTAVIVIFSSVSLQFSDSFFGL